MISPIQMIAGALWVLAVMWIVWIISRDGKEDDKKKGE